MPRIMVLNDGETFTDLTGCIMAEVSDSVVEKMMGGRKFINILESHTNGDGELTEFPDDIKIIAEFK